MLLIPVVTLRLVFVVHIAWEQVQLIYLIFAVLLGLALATVVVLLLWMKIFQAVKLGEAA